MTVEAGLMRISPAGGHPGAAALLMEWGITDGNDPFLYGEKVKVYL